MRRIFFRISDDNMRVCSATGDSNQWQRLVHARGFKSWHGNMRQQDLHQIITGLVFGFRFETRRESVTQHQRRDIFDILRNDISATIKERVRARRTRKSQRRAR